MPKCGGHDELGFQSANMKRYPRLAFVIESMTYGGAQRVGATLCNTWANTGCEVHLIDFQASVAPSFYRLKSEVRHHHLSLPGLLPSRVRTIANNFQRIRALRDTLQEISPDAVISFMPDANVIALLASIRQPWPVIVSERVHPAHNELGVSRSLARRLLYPFADAIIVQTADIARYIEMKWSFCCAVLPNPIDLDEFRPGSTRSGGILPKRIVAVGRLERQKGFDVLISAFTRVAGGNPSWDLFIFGEGPLGADLRLQAQGSGFSDRIHLLGTTGTISEELRKADIYIHPSRFEGSPNVVIEALACGCPVIATDSPGGTRELLADGVYGRLVPVDDINALADAIAALMADENGRCTMARRAPQAVYHLAADKISSEWLSIVNRAVAEKGGQFVHRVL